MRSDIAFSTEDGTTLRGWHYRPAATTSGRQPVIVMAHGFPAVKEMYLDRFAGAFAAAGLGALVFDHRGFGACDGTVRQEVDPEQHAWFTETAAARAPAWRNEVTVRSLDLFLGYDPSSLVALISPTPLLMIVGLADHLTPADLALAAYERALQPKRLVTLRGGHFDAYLGDFAITSAAAVDWFSAHLPPETAPGRAERP